MSRRRNDTSWPFRFLRWFCPPELLEEIEGDLLQRYERDLGNVSDTLTPQQASAYRRANRRLLWNTLRFFRPGILLRNEFKLITPMALFQNNIKMAFRVLRKDKLFSFINVSGLAMSITACLLIFQYTFYELSYDKQHPSLYRMGSVSLENGIEKYKSAITPVPAAPLLKEKLAGVADAVRLVSTSNWFDCTLSTTGGGDQKIFNEKKGFYFTDPSAASFLQLRFQLGDQAIALKEPFSIVLSSSAALKYFGSDNPLGKTLRLHGSFQTHDYTVTGVMEDFPINSHLDITILASLSSLPDAFDATTYVQLLPETDVDLFTQQLNELASANIPGFNKTESQFMLEEMSSIHLHSDLQDQPKVTGSATAIYFLMGIGVVILLMAWMNNINLTTSRAMVRAKEVGIRKVAGASRNTISLQFLTEALVVNMASLAIAIAFFKLASPMFYGWLGLPHITESPFRLPGNEWVALAIGIFVVGIFGSGFIPARLFASLNPVLVLKGKWRAARHGFSARKAILVFQFSSTVVLAIVVWVFQQQFEFLKEETLGVDIKRSIVLTAPANVDSTYLQKLSGFKDQLKSKAIIHSVTTSTDVPGNLMGSGWGGNISTSTDGKGITFGINVIDPDFIQSYGLKLLAGRNFTQNDFPGTHFGDKLESVIVNRKGAEVLLHTPEDALGATIYWGDSKCVIVGVIEEFHTESLKKAIQPMLYVANMGPSMTLKLTEGAEQNITPTVAQIKQAWQTFFPNNAFDYFLLEDRFNQQYDDDERLARLFNLFCMLAFTISGLGLLGLSLFSINQRLKEISIRKVLGAPFNHIILLLTREYLVLLAIATLVAVPLTYLGLAKWLSEYAVKIELTAWYFIVPVFTVVVFSLVTILSQTIKAIVRNPIDSLKHE